MSRDLKVWIGVDIDMHIRPRKLDLMPEMHAKQENLPVWVTFRWQRLA